MVILKKTCPDGVQCTMHPTVHHAPYSTSLDDCKSFEIKNAYFVILGHYGCPRGFLQKTLPVIVNWAKQMF